MNISPALQSRIVVALLKSKPGLTEQWDDALGKLGNFESVAEVIGLSPEKMKLANVVERALDMLNVTPGAPRSMSKIANLAAKPQGRMVVKAGLELASSVVPNLTNLLSDTLNTAITSGILPPGDPDQTVEDYLLDNVLSKYASSAGDEGMICRCPHCSNLFHIE